MVSYNSLVFSPMNLFEINPVWSADISSSRTLLRRLAIIAAEVNTETKVEFPAMRDLFYKNINKPNPADFVRASMSIPLFFKPFELSDLPNDKDSKLLWKRIAGHKGGVPEKAIFVEVSYTTTVVAPTRFFPLAFASAFA